MEKAGGGMKLRDRLFLWWHDYCPHHLIPRHVMYGFVWCDLCQKEEFDEEALRLQEIVRRVERIKEQA